MPRMFPIRVQMGFNVSTNVVWLLLFKRTFGHLFYSLNFFASSRPVLLIFKPCSFNSNTFFHVQEPSNLVQKPSSVLCTHYKLPNVRFV